MYGSMCTYIIMMLMIYWNITYWKQIALIQTTQPHSQTLKINLQLQLQLDGTTIPRPAHMFSVGHVILSVTSCRRLGKIVGGENTLSHVVTVVFFPPWGWYSDMAWNERAKHDDLDLFQEQAFQGQSWSFGCGLWPFSSSEWVCCYILCCCLTRWTFHLIFSSIG